MYLSYGKPRREGMDSSNFPLPRITPIIIDAGTIVFRWEKKSGAFKAHYLWYMRDVQRPVPATGSSPEQR